MRAWREGGTAAVHGRGLAAGQTGTAASAGTAALPATSAAGTRASQTRRSPTRPRLQCPDGSYPECPKSPSDQAGRSTAALPLRIAAARAGCGSRRTEAATRNLPDKHGSLVRVCGLFLRANACVRMHAHARVLRALVCACVCVCLCLCLRLCMRAHQPAQSRRGCPAEMRRICSGRRGR